jgi:hypothetical protein
MTTRRPLLPVPPPPVDVNTRYAYTATTTTTTATTQGDVGMEEQEEMQDEQDLSSQDADDDFERLMIQNARDERRLKDALHGSRRAQTFSKARKHPRVGLTLDNLERNNARNDAAASTASTATTTGVAAHAPVKLQSPPSSSGSARSDPAIHAPPTWGRKSRSNRNWMRTITYEEQAQTPPPADDTVNGLYDDPYEQPRRSIEDSPLSHKGTPRNDRSAEWDLTFELNEASMIASTPYIPRNTMLDDIRQREEDVSSLARVPEPPPDETRPLRVSFRANQTNTAELATQGSASPEKRLRNRTNSWQSIGKSQPVTGTGKENSPVTVYKTSTETVRVVERDMLTSTQQSPARPRRHRREDSQDLLRRLARASNTPSPGRIAALRPQTAPARQVTDSSQDMVVDTDPKQVHVNDELAEEEDVPPETVEHLIPDKEERMKERKQTQLQESKQTQPEFKAPSPVSEAEDLDATPMPSERPILDPKTPVVTGAWVDTPGPRTMKKHISIARSPSQSPRKSSPRKDKFPAKPVTPTVVEALESPAVETIRPQLSSSALQAVVQEAKAHGRRQSADFGDSTINSLEDLISSPPGAEVDEDTLQGLQLPSITPRNDAERQRQQELLHLHRMNDRLRAARTSIRDASRGMKRVEDRVEHGEEVNGGDKVVLRECPCALDGAHQPLLGGHLKSLFWDANLKAKRKGTSWRTMGGLTLFSIALLVLIAWWVSEEVACEFYCHHPYANYSPYAFSVNPDAPQYPFVIPTLVYRGLTCWLPPGWTGSSTSSQNNLARLHQGATHTAVWATQSQAVEEAVWDQSMLHDEVIR